MTSYAGSCHCGAVSFTFESGDIANAMSCNCSFCRRAGYLLTFGERDALKVTTKPGALGTYLFNKNVIDHHFCTQCGIATHGFGATPNGPMAAVNLRCIPSIDLDALAIQKVDGASF